MVLNFCVNCYNVQPDMMKYMICDILLFLHNGME